jgi:hypothetical protein
MSCFRKRGFGASSPQSIMLGLTFALAGFSGLASADQVVMPTRQKLVISATPKQATAAPNGVTAIAGEVVDMNGAGLPGVLIAEGSQSVVTRADGRFLLTYAIPGKGVLQIDGRAAGAKRADHGLYQVAVDAASGKTTILPFKSWLPVIDHTHDVAIQNPTPRPIVITNPALPGVEIRIPAGAVIRDADGALVKSIGITPLPAGKWPVPPPQYLDASASFTVQPGASCLYDAQGGVGIAHVIVPNSARRSPGARVQFFRYEPDAGGWRGYGGGSVSSDGKTILPDAATVLTEFASAECDPKTKSRPGPAQRIPVWISGSQRQ